MSAAPMVRIDNVSKSYGSSAAVDGVSLDVARGEIVALLGPSGCGKTTLLRMIANLVAPSGGDISIGGGSVVGLPAHLSEAAMVFQSYALFPHLSVERNVGFGLEVRGRPKREIAETVGRMLDVVGLAQFARRRPAQLSGGQQQRVALARALAISPKVLLLDEPFGALDKKLREEMEVEIARIIREFGMTTIFVTHDQDEALAMADRIAVMDRGRIAQVASGPDIYDRPANEFVAQFIGVANLLPGRMRAGGGTSDAAVSTAIGIDIPVRSGLALPDGTEVRVLVRPENIRLDAAPAGAPHGRGTIAFAVQYGSHTDIQVEAAGQVVKARTAPSRLPVGTQVGISVVDPGRCVIFREGSVVA